MSSKSVSSIQFLMRVWELIFVVFRPPYLSISRSRTKLKSPPTILWSFGRASIVCTNSMKNSGSSSFGAYKLTNVHLISSNSMSRTTYLPSLSVIHLWIVLCTFYLNKITTPFDAPVPCEKYMSPFHSFFQSLSVCVVLCVSCKRTILEFLFSNQCSTCLRFVLSPRPLTFRDTIWISLLMTIAVAIIESDTFVFWDLSWTF